MLKKLYLLAIAFIFSFNYSNAQGAWYVQDVDPWGQTININAMDAVFGIGNWQQATYSANALTVFAPGNSVVFLEGSDQNATAFNNFVSANIAVIENWVFNGGHLFLNAAPGTGGNINLGFGNIVLNYPVFSAVANATNPSEQIFLGPYTPVTTNYTGNYSAHGYLTGPGLISLMENDSAQVVLARMDWGAGEVYFGALTQPNFWNPNPEATNLWQNILFAVTDSMITFACTAPDSLSVSNITISGADLNWTGTATSYEYVIDASANSPAVNGTVIFTDSFSATGLQHDSTYYFHVRAICDSIHSSAWITIAFTTAHLNTCAAPTGNATVSFTQVNPYAVLNWSAPDAVQYLWTLDNSPADPTVMGTATANTSISFANLLPNTAYYFHVRCVCTSGDTSAWTTIMFITASCPFPMANATVDQTQNSPFAVVNWSAPTSATYWWVLDQSASDPTVAGNMTTATSITFANLLTGTDYYFHVRCICTNGDTSTWTTIMFHTPGMPTAINNVNNKTTAIICSPNPTSGKITVSVTGTAYNDATVTLTGLDGKVLYNAPVIGNKAEIDMSSLPAAVYFVKYTNKDYSDIIKVMKQ